MRKEKTYLSPSKVAFTQAIPMLCLYSCHYVHPLTNHRKTHHNLSLVMAQYIGQHSDARLSLLCKSASNQCFITTEHPMLIGETSTSAATHDHQQTKASSTANCQLWHCCTQRSSHMFICPARGRLLLLREDHWCLVLSTEVGLSRSLHRLIPSVQG